MPADRIIIKGAKEHNLKNIDLEIPREKFVVITGISGSGKSSLAFDTIYAEGQRRYVESLSSYARQFLEQVKKPNVESIEGLSPAISVEQKSVGKNPRSTVGTITEIYDYLRLLYARVGTPHCHKCGKPINAQTITQMVDQVMSMEEGRRISILAPIVSGRKGEYRKELEFLRKQGYIRAKIDGTLRELDEEIALDKNKRHDIEVVVDRIILKDSIRDRLTDSIETALRLAQGIVRVEIGSKDITLSEKLACSDCGISIQELSPRMFSFNSPHGACPECSGLGVKINKMPTQWNSLCSLEGLELEEEFHAINQICPTCDGTRLKPESRSVKIGGMSICDMAAQPVAHLLNTLEKLELPAQKEKIAERILKEIKERLSFLIDVGLGYLTLDRASYTLSGGEAQRIRLATQIASRLVGVLYILDEPTIGLHQRDNAKLLAILKGLRDLGNTVLVVEHDRNTILSADYVIDMGPGAGEAGGRIVAYGPPQDIIHNKASLTGRYLSGELRIPLPKKTRKGNGKFLTIIKARENNLKNITVKIPLGLFICITGVSGSGKSTLVIDTLYRALAQKLYNSKKNPGKHERIEGMENIDKVIDIDQTPIGRTPRSNPATYTGLFKHIRELFSGVQESRIRGYTPSRYSFNVKGGRCEACKGDGVKKIEMQFLPNIYVPCEECQGNRYNRDTLQIKYKGKNIHDILDMTVDEALKFFKNIPIIRKKLQTLADVGMGYIKLGQPATTLSGGEAQRIKLAKELSRKATGRTLYILDEPTTGLHFADIQKLLEILNRLADEGNTIIVIEHNMDVIKTADYIIDLGPEGGDKGGEIVAQGTPWEISSIERSYTGQLLMEMLA